MEGIRGCGTTTTATAKEGFKAYKEVSRMGEEGLEAEGGEAFEEVTTTTAEMKQVTETVIMATGAKVIMVIGSRGTNTNLAIEAQAIISETATCTETTYILTKICTTEAQHGRTQVISLHGTSQLPHYRWQHRSRKRLLQTMMID